MNGATAPEKRAAVYTSHDIVCYEDRDTYDSGDIYSEGTGQDKHTAEEAAAHTVVNITQAGTYRLSGTLSQGQIAVDLGEDAKRDPTAAVTLILDGVDITCTVAPAVIFYRVYECDTDWVAYDEGETEGTGVLNIVAENEGLDSELHLTINGGKVNIQSQNDGINTNEDGVSVTTVNGGSLHVMGGLGTEGDGIGSNGWLVINGGVVIATANPASDSGLDSDMGSYINGGYVVATGSAMDGAESSSAQVTMNLQFAGPGGQIPPERTEGAPPELPEGAPPQDGRPNVDRPGGEVPEGEPAEKVGTPAQNDGGQPPSVRFYMADQVNAFSGVADEAAEAEKTGS